MMLFRNGQQLWRQSGAMSLTDLNVIVSNITLMLSSCEILTALFGDVSSDDFKDKNAQSSQTRKVTKTKQILENY